MPKYTTQQVWKIKESQLVQQGVDPVEYMRAQNIIVVDAPASAAPPPAKIKPVTPEQFGSVPGSDYTGFVEGLNQEMDKQENVVEGILKKGTNEGLDLLRTGDTYTRSIKVGEKILGMPGAPQAMKDEVRTRLENLPTRTIGGPRWKAQGASIGPEPKPKRSTFGEVINATQIPFRAVGGLLSGVQEAGGEFGKLAASTPEEVADRLREDAEINRVPPETVAQWQATMQERIDRANPPQNPRFVDPANPPGTAAAEYEAKTMEQVAGRMSQDAKEQGFNLSPSYFKRLHTTGAGDVGLPGGILNADDALGTRIAQSASGERERFIGDVFAEALKSYKGKDLTPGENLTAQMFGLAADLLVTGKGLEFLRPVKEIPKAQAATGQLGKAFGATGVKPMPERLQAIAEHAFQAPSRPEQILRMRQGLMLEGKLGGLNDAEIAILDRKFIQTVGTEGQKAGVRGLPAMLPTTEKAAATKQAAELGGGMGPWVDRPNAIPGFSKVPPSSLPMGAASQVPPWVRKFFGRPAEELSWGANTVPGMKETVREGQAVFNRMADEGVVGANDIAAVFKTPERKRWALLQDMQANRRDLDRELRELAASKDDLKALKGKNLDERVKYRQGVDDTIALREQQWDEAVKRVGLTRAEVDAGFKASNPEQQAVVEAVQREMDKDYKLLNDSGLMVEYRQGYVGRIETEESRKGLAPILGEGPRGSTKPSMTKGRLTAEDIGSEAKMNLNLKGTGNHKFEEDMAIIFARHKAAVGAVVSKNKITNDVLKSYARKLPGEPTAAERRVMEKEGNWIYRRPNTDDFYVLDEANARFLERVTKPSKPMNGFMRWLFSTYAKAMTTWKIGATITTPGFAVRNEIGNLFNQFGEGINVAESFRDALRIQANIFARSPVGRTPKGRMALENFIEKMLGKKYGFAGPTEKIGKYTVDEMAEAVLSNKVTGTNWFKTELGKGQLPGGWGPKRIVKTILPIDRDNPIINAWGTLNDFFEENGKIGSFANRMKHGYSAPESSTIMARSLFNYDELTPIGQAVKTISPFPVWMGKNIAFQAGSLARKPDRVAKFWRLKEGIENLDPKTTAEKQEAEYNPEWAKQGVTFDIPGTRSAKGERQSVMLGNFIPQAALSQVFDIPIAQTAYNTLHPAYQWVVDQLSSGGMEGKMRQRSFWGTPASERDTLVWAPGWVPHLMETARTQAPELFSTMSEAFHPVKNSRGRIIGYKMSAKTSDRMTSAVPLLGKINRAWKQSGAEEVYDAMVGHGIGIKPFSITKQMRDKEEIARLTETLERFNQMMLELYQTNVTPNPVNPSAAYPTAP
jgi:hypothetical protein